MIQCALSPSAFKEMLEVAGGITFNLHSDFYDDDGVALQPHGI